MTEDTAVELPVFVQEFAELAYMNGMRAALHAGEFLPIPEGIMVVVAPDDNLLGARMYFEPPVKCVWIAPNQACTYGTYDGGRTGQSPLTARFYVFSGDKWDRFESADIYENPAA